MQDPDTITIIEIARRQRCNPYVVVLALTEPKLPFPVVRTRNRLGALSLHIRRSEYLAAEEAGWKIAVRTVKPRRPKQPSK